MPELPTYTATRYVQPLREGGSLPAVVETDTGQLFVAKFRGAGQGARALIAELIVGLLAQTMELPTPELALIDVPSAFGRSEPDPEIQDLLRASHGVNAGMRYLDGAFNFDPLAAGDLIASDLAARILWLDAFVTNPDRTHRNPNMLVWNRQPWLIDHGAALYAHHDWASVDETRTRTPFALIRDHILLTRSDDLKRTDAQLTRLLDGSVIRDIMAAVPDALLGDPLVLGDFATPDALRDRYATYLEDRLHAPHLFVDEAINARERARRDGPQRLAARR